MAVRFRVQLRLPDPAGHPVKLRIENDKGDAASFAMSIIDAERLAEALVKIGQRFLKATRQPGKSRRKGGRA